MQSEHPTVRNRRPASVATSAPAEVKQALFRSTGIRDPRLQANQAGSRLRSCRIAKPLAMQPWQTAARARSPVLRKDCSCPGSSAGPDVYAAV